MAAKIKFKIISISLLVLAALGLFIFFKYFFTYEQRQQVRRQIGSVTGQNLTVTIFGFDGRIIKRWTGVQKITSGRAKDDSGERNYTYFYTREGKYVQIPDSVWYMAEEE
ncbi:MAG: hypothetical protein A2W19_08785 [Spirochaetes bacterium RBG_16_49_21]|nr:MAG: hypothetical protein A2W19_08785 [Spirochaetes bacterium RBG_16_49_21]